MLSPSRHFAGVRAKPRKIGGYTSTTKAGKELMACRFRHRIKFAAAARSIFPHDNSAAFAFNPAIRNSSVQARA